MPLQLFQSWGHKNLTFTLYCGDVWGRRGFKTLLVWYLPNLGLPCPKYSESFAKIRDAALKFVSLRPKSHQIAPYRYRAQTYCLREQTHSSELQLVFVNHSQQIVLYRQILRLCNKFSKLSFKIRLNSQINSIRKASSNGFAYVWGGLYER